MRIILVHFRAGEKDGVSLEMEKWEKVFQTMGHKIKYMAGSLGKKEGFVVPSMEYDHPINDRVHSQAFEKLSVSESHLKSEIVSYSQKIENEVSAYMRKWKPELLVVNNLWSLGHNLAASIAFYNVVKNFKVRVIGHHHDFYWERARYSHPTCKFVVNTLTRYFPPDDLNMKHVVINKIAQTELKKRKKVNAKVIPNVFDFEQEQWIKDSFNANMRKAFGISEKDIVFLQATRIIKRKAIELAVDFVAEFQNCCLSKLIGNDIYNGRKIQNDSRVILFLAGSPESDSLEYLEKLQNYACSKHVKLILGYEFIGGKRETNDEKIYSLWDAYTIADAVTYTSIKEGWGNQFIEAIFAKLPVIVFEYPVFKSDIKPLKFWSISLGDKFTMNDGFASVNETKISQASQKLCDAFLDKEMTSQMLDNNFYLAKKHLSLKVLSEYLREIL